MDAATRSKLEFLLRDALTNLASTDHSVALGIMLGAIGAWLQEPSSAPQSDKYRAAVSTLAELGYEYDEARSKWRSTTTLKRD